VLVAAAASVAGCGGGTAASGGPSAGTGPSRAALRQGFSAFIAAARAGGRPELAGRFKAALASGSHSGVGLFVVPSTAMAPALRRGDRVVAEPAKGPLARGDIVVLTVTQAARAACHAPSARAELMKRVVGLPGDRIRLVAGSGRVLVNGRPYDVPVASPNRAAASRVFRVPAGDVFVLGDNRRSSCDSAAWSDPYVPRANVRWRIEGIYYPSARAGLVA